MFEGESSLNLPVTVWAGICTLWFIAYALGVHNITYRLENGVDKQVGLFWAPSWNIGEAIFIPLFLITASDAIAHWKHVGRPTIHGEGGDGNIGWARKLANHEIAYRGILLVSLIAITILQWVGVYLLSFLSDDGSPIMVDWILVSVVRPDEVSTVVALWVSVFAYLYNGYIYWLFLNGAMLLYQIVTDLSETFHLRADASGSPNVRETVDAVQNSIFRGAVYGSVLAICVKLNATYIESDGGNIVNWLVSDALLGLGFRALQGWQWIDGSSPSSFSSVLLLFVVIFVYVKGELQIRKIRADLGLHVTGSRTNSVKAALRPISVALLVVGFAGIGNFYGFSIVMVLTMVIALWGTYFLKSKSAEF